MFISKRQYNRLVERIEDLEKQVYLSSCHSTEPLGETVGLLLRHLDLKIQKPYCYPKVMGRKDGQ